MAHVLPCDTEPFLANHQPTAEEEEARGHLVVGPSPAAMFFCAACNVYVKDSSVVEHDQTTTHLLSSSKGISVRKGARKLVSY